MVLARQAARGDGGFGGAEESVKVIGSCRVGRGPERGAVEVRAAVTLEKAAVRGRRQLRAEATGGGVARDRGVGEGPGSGVRGVLCACSRVCVWSRVVE